MDIVVNEVAVEAGGGGGGRAGGAVGRATRGAAWTGDEDIAILEAYVHCTYDAVVGANQKVDDFVRAVRERFLCNKRAPTIDVHNAYSASSIKRTRWHGRQLRSISTRCAEMKKLGNAFNGKVQIIESMELTGNVAEHGVYRAALYLFNGNPVNRSDIYKIAEKASDVDVGPKFKFESAYLHARTNSNLMRIFTSSPTTLAGGSENVDDEAGFSSGGRLRRHSRPQGQKSTKKARLANGDEDDALSGIAGAAVSFASTYAARGSSLASASADLSARECVLAYGTLYNNDYTGDLEAKEEARKGVHEMLMGSMKKLNLPDPPASEAHLSQHHRCRAVTTALHNEMNSEEEDETPRPASLGDGADSEILE
jgi:hypothetical protein